MIVSFSGNSYNSISVSDLDRLLGKIALIDIRETYEYNSGHVPSAKNIPMSTLLSDPSMYLDKGKVYHIICQSGGRSSRACEELTSMGFNVVNVSGGTGSYLKTLER